MDTSRLQSLFGLEGKRAVVTGGSRGIGYMIADGLLDAGADVIISARKENQVAEAVESLSAKGNIEGIPADLTRDLSAEVDDRLDILCNNAGSGVSRSSRSRRLGRCQRAGRVLPHAEAARCSGLVPTPRDRIINTGSTSSVTKAAVLTRHLGKELAPA